MLWINFLHLYQPANSEEQPIREATEKSYLRIIRGLEEHPNIKFTLNISGCLILRWQELGYEYLIERIGKLIKRGQLEITGTAAYHPLLPLVPREEAISQIKENENILKKYFGQNFKPKGFFLPEMAYSADISKIIKKLGYEWIILDEISYKGKLGKVDFKKIYKDKNSSLKIIFRSREFSNQYVPDYLIKKSKGEIFITGTDAELYGLRFEDPTAIFEKLLNKKDLQSQTISEFIDSAQTMEEINPVPSSWETTEKEIKNHNPYILWYNKDNDIQMKVWELANLTYKIVAAHKNNSNYGWARWHLVRGLASCTFWWASEKDFGYVFGPQAWNPDEIEKRINELVRAVRALEDDTKLSTKIKIEDLALDIRKIIWRKHWKLKHKNKKRS